jgi:hypothetical protein
MRRAQARTPELSEDGGLGDRETLRVVDADRAQRIQDREALDRFGDRLLAHDVADPVDRLDHRVVDRDSAACR